MRFLTFTPWQGQFNNTRMCLETALVLAFLSRRCLVLPADYRRAHEPEVDGGRFRPLHPGECFDLRALHGLVDVIEATEYERLVERNSRPCELILPPGSVFCYPRIPLVGSTAAARLAEFALYRRKFIEFPPESEHCATLHLTPGDLELFYTFCFFTDSRSEVQCKRLVRDGLRFHTQIEECAARIADSLGSYCALHVRRNDFFDLYPQQNISANRLLGNVLMHIPAGERLYIATDETDRAFFADLANHYDVCFLDDCRPLTLSPCALACVEQLICTRASTFIGTRLSTFSAYVTRLRGYRDARDQRSHFTDGSPGIETDDEHPPLFSWTNWVRSGYPLWGGEFREGWEF